MALRVSGKNIAIGDALRSHVQTRIDLVFAKFGAGQVLGHVTIEPEGSGYRTDCALHLPSGTTLQVDGVAQEPYASVNLAVERFEKRLRRYRRRLRDHHASVAAVPVPDSRIDDVYEDDAEVGEAVTVVAERAGSYKRMSVSRAALELDETKAPVLVFDAVGDGRPNIVYRRPDGHIGWIDPAAFAS